MPKRLDPRGFSLAEVLLAGVLLAGVVVMTLRMFTNAALLSPTSVYHAEAYNLAQDKLEELHEMARQDWWNVAGKPLSDGTYPASPETITINGKSYTRQYTVSTISLPSQDYKKVVLSVREV